MLVYGRIQDGALVEIIQPGTYTAEGLDWIEGMPSRIGLEIPIAERFTPELVATMVDITEVTPQPQIYWVYDGAAFSEPVPYQSSQEETRTANEAQQAALIAQASQAMTPLLLSLQMGDATAEEAVTAKAWQAYYRALNAVDVTATTPDWPVAPQLNKHH